MASTFDPSAPRQFLTTRWSMVAAAGKGQSSEAGDAMADLCKAYWYPLYAFLRRSGKGQVEAQDLTQAFFTSLIEKRGLRAAEPNKGRFRSYILGALRHFLSNEHDRAAALKRGGEFKFHSLDWESAEGKLGPEPQARTSPESAFDRDWALVLVDRAFERTRDDFERAGKATLFAALSTCLTEGEPPKPYSELCADLDLGEGAFRVAVHRARRHFRECLRREIAETLSDPSKLDEELNSLFGALEN